MALPDTVLVLAALANFIHLDSRPVVSLLVPAIIAVFQESKATVRLALTGIYAYTLGSSPAVCSGIATVSAGSCSSRSRLWAALASSSYSPRLSSGSASPGSSSGPAAGLYR